jgi:exonuclease SbcD
MRGLVPTAQRSILVAHAFVQGGLTSDSERALQVGGTGAVSAAHLSGFDYVALGHLHRRQAMDGGRIAYSGSPLAYSFSEVEDTKSLSLVELGRDGSVRAEAIAVSPRRRLRTMRGTLAEVLAAADGPGREDWLQVTLTDRAAYGAKLLLNERYPSVLDLRFEAAGAPHQAAEAAARTGDDPLALFEAFWHTLGEGTLGAEERRLAAAAIATASTEEA